MATLEPPGGTESLDAECIAVFGGIYSNYLALAATLADATARGAERIYCLGDLGGFGPHPDRVQPLLERYGVHIVQGNYDAAVGNALEDCGCGYTDPRDNAFAQLSYDYTLANTSEGFRKSMRDLKPQHRLVWRGWTFHLCHGSPRQVNEFLWESTTPDGLIDRFCLDHAADVILCTHTGIKWQRLTPAGHRLINVGAIGRPENDGTPRVWYCLLRLGPDGWRPPLALTFLPVTYDCHGLAREMDAEGLPSEFIDTILSGHWTTCLEILPGKERSRGRF